MQDEASQLIGELVSPPRGRDGARPLRIAGRQDGGDQRRDRRRRRRGRVGCAAASRAAARAHAGAGAACPTPRSCTFRRRARCRFATATFDVVLIDAPCSGLGTVRRDPDIRWRRSRGRPAALRRGAARAAGARGRPRQGRAAGCSTAPARASPKRTRRSSPLPRRAARFHAGAHRIETLPFRDRLEAFFGVP